MSATQTRETDIITVVMVMVIIVRGSNVIVSDSIV